jgi:hypothetical protein
LKNAATVGTLGGLGIEALKGTSAIPFQGNLTQQATALQGEAQQLLNPLLNGGPLPAGAQQGITNAVNAATAAIKSKYASLGMSGSSAELEDLQNVQNQAAAQQFTIAQQLASQGLQASGMATQDYQTLANDILTQDQSFTKALASLAGGLAGGTK